MPKFIVKPDCGNSPRKKFLKDFYAALVSDDWEFIGPNISLHFTWTVAGREIPIKADKFPSEHKKLGPSKAKEFRINTIITHGPEAAVSGTLTPISGPPISFCDLFTFKGAGGTLVESIFSFHVKTKK